MPGCDMECRMSNTGRRREWGTKGLYLPVEVSHMMVSPVGFKGTHSSVRLEDSG